MVLKSSRFAYLIVVAAALGSYEASLIMGVAHAQPSARAGRSSHTTQRVSSSSSPISIRGAGSLNEVVINTHVDSPRFSVHRLASPDRLVVDLEGERLASGSALESSGLKYVSAVRVGAHPTKSRVVIDLKGASDLEYAARIENGSVVVRLSPHGVPQRADGAAVASSDRASPSPGIFQKGGESKPSGLTLDEDAMVSGSSGAVASPKVAGQPVATKTGGVRQEGILIPGIRSEPAPATVAEDSVSVRAAPSAKVFETKSTKAPRRGLSLDEDIVSSGTSARVKTLADLDPLKSVKVEGVAAAPNHEPASADAVLARTDLQPKVGEPVATQRSSFKSIALEGQGAQPSVVVGIGGPAEYSMARTAPSEYVLTLRDIAADDNLLKQTLFTSKESSGIRSVRMARDGDDVLVRIFAQPSSYLTAKKVDGKLIIQETQDLSQIAKDIRAQMAPPSAQDANAKDPSSPTAAAATPTKADSSSTDKGTTGQPKNIDPKGKKPDVAKQNGDPIAKKPDADKQVAAEASKRESSAQASKQEAELAAIRGNSVTYTGRLISLDLQDADIDSALRIIAEVSNLNIVAGEGVVGKVTLKLVDVPWDQALDVILKNAGLDKVLEGNVLRVAPVDKLKAERESFKQARVAEEELEPLSVKYMRISYAKASEIKALVETVLTERGTVAFDERSNQLVVKDVRKGLQNVTELIRKVDLRTPQILLETQIVEANRNLSRQLGSELGFQYIQSPATGNGTGLNFPSAIAVGGSVDPTNGITGSAFPIPVSSAAGSAITMLFDSADGTKNLQLRLTQLEQQGQVRIVSKPAVATTNNKPAEIKSVEKYRVKLPNGGLSIATGSGAQSTGAGNVATQTIEAGIVLNVTPQASPDYYILLDIQAKSSSFGAQKVDGIPNEIERSASSSVLVSSGQTFALGGIYKITENEALTGVPFFKDIPVLGTFFRSSVTENKDEELLFFITPRIVEGSFEDASLNVVS